MIIANEAKSLLAEAFASNNCDCLEVKEGENDKPHENAVLSLRKSPAG
jgi:hypothetical protein